MTPALQRYEWGSTTAIPSMLGLEPTGEPVAEAWWGAHPSAPAMVDVDGTLTSLADVITADADGTLGEAVATPWEGQLPYLLKVLAIHKPLSIQVHPTIEQAREGFAREDAAGVLLNSRERTFKDTWHKPEVLVAITPMLVLTGFREPGETIADLARIGGEQAGRLRDTLAAGRSSDAAIDAYVRSVLAMERDASVLTDLVRTANHPDASPSHLAAARAAHAHPGDVGALVALAMNLVELAPGQAVFTDAGVVHSYQSGVGLEVMANSDNVVRGGLTPKPIDVNLLSDLAVTEPSAPAMPAPLESGSSRMFVTPAKEYALTIVGEGTDRVEGGPRMVLALGGATSVSAGHQTMELHAGQAVFVPHSDGALEVVAHGTAAVISVPVPRAR